MVRGRYNTRELEARLRARGAEHTTYGKHTLYGNGQSVIAFIGESVAVGGSTPAVKAALDTYDQRRGGLPGTLRPLVEALDPSDQLWAVGAGSLSGMGIEAQGNSRLADIAQLLRGVRAALAGIDVSNGLNLTGRIDCDTETAPGTSTMHCGGSSAWRGSARRIINRNFSGFTTPLTSIRLNRALQ